MSVGRSLLGLVRSLHIYLSALAAALLLLAALTGFLLNHGGRFGLDEPRTRTQELTLPAAAMAQPDKILIELELRRQLGSLGQLDSFEAEPEEIRITFKKPGSRTDALVDRTTGQTEVTVESRGVTGVMTDLHKGSSAGAVWSYVIDAAAVLLALVSVTGLVLMVSMPRRRWLRVGVTIAGIAAVIAGYFLTA